MNTSLFHECGFGFLDDGGTIERSSSIPSGSAFVGSTNAKKQKAKGKRSLGGIIY